MRFTILMLLTFVFCLISTYAISQNARVSIRGNNMTLDDLISEIERQTDYLFIYNRDVKSDRKVSLHIKNKPTVEVLKNYFEGSDIQFVFEGNHILVSRTQNQDKSSASPESKLITGRITRVNGSPLSGAVVKYKGSGLGVASDTSGNYSIPIKKEEKILVYSFVGMETKEVVWSGNNHIDVALKYRSIPINNIVITALGILRSKSVLGFSVGEVKCQTIGRISQQNLLNSLPGLVSGLTISNSSNDINAETYVTIRGLGSLSGNNAPLVILDGVPAGDHRVMKDISSDDIESVSVLKGSGAAALYGSRAGNGVILISSKSGEKSKGRIGVTVNLGTTIAVPYEYIKLQNRFTTGKSGVFIENAYQQWYGPEKGNSAIQWNSNGLPAPLVFYQNSLKDYFQSGVSTIGNIGLSRSFENGYVRLAISHLKENGVYPGVEQERSGLNTSLVYNLTPKVKIVYNLDISNPRSNNYPVQNNDITQYVSVYQIPPHVNINDLKDYWLINNEKQRTVSTNYNNPWFAAYELKNKFIRTRGVGGIKIDYQMLPELSFMGRFALSTVNEKSEYQQPWSSYAGDGGGYNTPKGRYTQAITNHSEMNMDFLVSYKKHWGNIGFEPKLGGNIMKRRSYVLNTGGDNLVLPGLFTLANVSRGSLIYDSGEFNKNIHSLYANAILDFKNSIYLDVTARNDWSSTLHVANRSYFYPSASLSILLNRLIKVPEWVSQAKLRTGIANVGKDTDPYVIVTTLQHGSWGNDFTYSVPAGLSNINLKPEIARSFEVGADATFLANRLGFDFTIYQALNKNQILYAGTSAMSGYTSALINAGVVEKRGIEMGLSFIPVQSKDFKWDFALNFSKERSQLKALTTGIDQFLFWESTQVYSLTKIGGYIGDIYARDCIRVKEGPYKGWPLLDANGKLQRDNSNVVKVGNYMHDFMMGMQTNLSYKRLTLSINLDWRQGGEFYDQTMMRLARAGKIEKFHDNANSSTFSGIINANILNGNLDAIANEIKSNPKKYQDNVWAGGRTKDLGGFLYNGVYDGAFYPGVIADGNGGYKENFGAVGTQYIQAWDVYSPSGGYWDTAINNKWIYDASFLKLREVSLSFQLPQSWLKTLGANEITLTAFLKNVLVWSAAKTNTDPESNYMQDGTSTRQGLSYWNGSPIIMPMGCKVSITF